MLLHSLKVFAGKFVGRRRRGWSYELHMCKLGPRVREHVVYTKSKWLSALSFVVVSSAAMVGRVPENIEA